MKKLLYISLLLGSSGTISSYAAVAGENDFNDLIKVSWSTKFNVGNKVLQLKKLSALIIQDIIKNGLKPLFPYEINNAALATLNDKLSGIINNPLVKGKEETQVQNAFAYVKASAKPIYPTGPTAQQISAQRLELAKKGFLTPLAPYYKKIMTAIKDLKGIHSLPQDLDYKKLFEFIGVATPQ